MALSGMDISSKRNMYEIEKKACSIKRRCNLTIMKTRCQNNPENKFPYRRMREIVYKIANRSRIVN